MKDFVDLEQIDPTIVLDIRYATINNFMDKQVYSLPKCFLRSKVAEKISLIQSKLTTHGLGLKIYDGYRPWSVTNFFWNLCPDPRYCADPLVGSRHNRGAAVDVTLIDLSTGKELPMPSEFDDLTSRSHRDFRDCSEEMLDNRARLEEAFLEYQFIPLPTEWWHFDDENWEQYPVENISFEEILYFYGTDRL